MRRRKQMSDPKRAEMAREQAVRVETSKPAGHLGESTFDNGPRDQSRSMSVWAVDVVGALNFGKAERLPHLEHQAPAFGLPGFLLFGANWQIRGQSGRILDRNLQYPPEADGPLAAQLRNPV